MKKAFTTICLLSGLVMAAPAKALDLRIANHSRFVLTQVSTSSKQMATWRFPTTLFTQSQKSSNIDWKFGFFVDVFGDWGKTTYEAKCSNGRTAQITIHAFMKPSDTPTKRYYSQFIHVQQQGASCIIAETSWDVFKDTTGKSSVKLNIYNR